MDKCHALASKLPCVDRDPEHPTVDRDIARSIWSPIPRKNLHKRGLPRTVLPEKRMDLSRLDAEVHIDEGARLPEAL